MVLSETEIQFQTSGLMTYWNSLPLGTLVQSSRSV